MDHEQYREWLSGIDRPGPAQRKEAEAVPSGGSRASASPAAVEAAVGEDRRCPHCGTPGAGSRGKARGLRRYQCKGCGRTFNAATGTPLSGLHRREGWPAFGNCLSEGMTVRASAGHCRLAAGTSFRRRHRFPAARQPGSRKLTGIPPPGETHAPESRKGAARRAGAAARPAGAACRMNRFRCRPCRPQRHDGQCESSGGQCRCPAQGHRTRHGRGYRAGERWSPSLSTLRRRYGCPPRSAQPVWRRAGSGRLSHSDGEQPTQPIEGFVAALPRHRDQISRQLPAMVSTHRTGERLVTHLSCSRNRQVMHTICKLSLLF